MAFSQALSGLSAASTDLNVVSNNISNSQTVGFKSSTTQFADVYSGADVGLGTQVSGVVQERWLAEIKAGFRKINEAVASTPGGSEAWI